jgi:CubicO group peptidase (beta-lactamase class C family)
MATLQTLLDKHEESGSVPGAVALVARGDEVERACAGVRDLESQIPMTPDTLFRLASITKPIVAAAVLTLVDEGRLRLDDPIAQWLPELAEPKVVRTPDADIDDVVPADRPITVFHVLSSQCGWGFPQEFDLPAVQALFGLQTGLDIDTPPAPDEWLAALARIPLLHQPGQGWLYNTSSDLQGLLIQRVCGRPLAQELEARILEPLGMTDTAFAGAPERLPALYKRGAEGLELFDAPDGRWSTPATFPSGAGGLVGTAGDWLAFGRMLLAGGTAPGDTTAGGARVLSPGSVRLMTTDHLTGPLRKTGELFLEGQGWGFGGSVDVERIDPWNVPGRYGWVGGSGTSAHIVPSEEADGSVAVLLTQVAMTDPTPPAVMREFWTYASAASEQV